LLEAVVNLRTIQILLGQIGLNHLYTVSAGDKLSPYEILAPIADDESCFGPRIGVDPDAVMRAS
jgi:hypothetical protein